MSLLILGLLQSKLVILTLEFNLSILISVSINGISTLNIVYHIFGKHASLEVKNF